MEGGLLYAVRAKPMSEAPLVPPEEATQGASLINRIVSAALRQRFLTLLMTVLLVGAGLWSYSRLPVDAYPDLSPPQVEITTQWEGHAAEEVERLITVPLEVEMNGVPHMTTMRSISLYGLSSVRLTFDYGTDNYFVTTVGVRTNVGSQSAGRRIS